MNIKGKIASALFATLLLAACGGGMSGTYVDSEGNPAITFSGSKADLDLGAAGTREMNYSVNGNKVVLHGPGGMNMVLTRKPDGSLDTPWGTFKPKH